MYEPYEDNRGSWFKRFINKVRDKFEGFKQELKFKEFDSNKWIAILIPLALILLIGISITGYATFTARITEAQSKVMVMEKQMDTLQNDLDKTNENLKKCSSDLEAAKEDYKSLKSVLEETQSELETCQEESKLTKADLTSQLEETQKNLDKMTTSYNTLEANYKTLECNFFTKVCNGYVYYTVKNFNIDCCIKTPEGKYYCGIGIETPESKIKTC